jgi:hypothetical protein
VASIAVDGNASRVAPRVARVVGAGVVLVVALAIGAFVGADTDGPTGLVAGPVTEVPRLVEVSGAAAIVVRVGRTEHAFLATDARGDPLAYCRSSGRFVSQLWASQFALDGRKLGGPAPRGLDEYAMHRDGDLVFVHTDRVVKGEGYQGSPATSLTWRKRLTLTPTWCPGGDETRRANGNH